MQQSPNLMGLRATLPIAAFLGRSALRCAQARENAGDIELAKKLDTYTRNNLDSLRADAVQKPFGSVFEIRSQHVTSVTEIVHKATAEEATPLGAWLRDAMCAAPVQITRCSGNALDPMHDGMCMEANYDDQIEDIVARLRFGPLESVLRAHGGPVKVASALGQQSVGKSYHVNHLGGCFFDVAGGRCTEGIWMSARHFTGEGGEKVLVVFLDCEGIGSHERSGVEDMLHCLFLGAVSTLTMYKTESAFNRRLEDTLEQMNQGSKKVSHIVGSSGKSLVYRGQIMFCLKDVLRDTTSIKNEFKDRLFDMAQGQDNFLSNLFNGAVSINPFPPLSRRFFTKLKDCATVLMRPDSPSYNHGTQTLDVMKLSLVKMAVKDWTSIDRQFVSSQTQATLAAMDAVAHFGCYGKINDARIKELTPLKPQQDLATEESLTFSFTVAQELTHLVTAAQRSVNGTMCTTRIVHTDDDPQSEMSGYTLETVMSDENFRLALPLKAGTGDRSVQTTATEDCERIKSFVAETFQLDQNCDEVERLRLLQCVTPALISAIITRRERVAHEWLRGELSDVNDANQRNKLTDELSGRLQKTEVAMQMCTSVCNKCYLPCVQIGPHREHLCGTDHRCKSVCKYCMDENGMLTSCMHPAGHTGSHKCDKTGHVCGKACHLFGVAGGCLRWCNLGPDHYGPCDCRAPHVCGEKCDLEGCDGVCQMPYGVPHDRCDCGKMKCCHVCQLCERPCSGSHFHSVDNPRSHHLCGRAHECRDPVTKSRSLCETAGVCFFETKLKKVEKQTFEGLRDKFDYERVSQMVEQRNLCTVTIPPGELSHDGPCRCDKAEEDHYCGHSCPQCTYMCNKPFGHAGKHSTHHGNLDNWEMLTAVSQFQLSGRKYARGDRGSAETCESYCRGSGRGHTHFGKFDPAICSPQKPGFRYVCSHGSEASTSQSAEEIDLVECSHEEYWNMLDFEDPCTEQHQANFKLCGAACRHSSHEGGEDKSAYCELPLWHDPLDPALPLSQQPQVPSGFQGYISTDGHLFTCNHNEDGPIHTFFVIDKSKSMSDSVIQPKIREICNHWRSHKLMNVLGVVHEACYQYICSRRVKSPADRVTYVAFDDNAYVLSSGAPVTDPGLLNVMMKVYPKYGTQFHRGLNTAYDALQQWRQRHPDRVHKPVFILLTDSKDATMSRSIDVLQNIMAQEAAVPEEKRLSLHVFTLGGDVRGSFGEQLARIGNGEYFACPIQCTIDGRRLVRSFVNLAATPAMQLGLSHCRQGSID